MRFALLTVMTAWAVALAACVTMPVNSFSERGVNFSRYRTFGWAPAQPESTGDPRFDNNPFFEERVQADIEKQLAARGFQKTSGAARSDLIVHYHANFKEAVDFNGIDRERGYCETTNCQPYVYDTGTLVVDLVDARTSKLVWRGWAEGALEGAAESQKIMEQLIDAAVPRILDKLPRPVGPAPLG